MKQLLLLIIVLNILFFSWKGYQYLEEKDAEVIAEQVPIAAAESDSETLRLLEEVMQQPVLAKAKPPPQVAEPKIEGLCYRLGNFDAITQKVGQAAKWLRQHKIPVTQHERVTKRTLVAHRLYLPPLSNRGAADGMVKTLQQVVDKSAYVIEEGERTNGILIGEYKSEAIARQNQAKIKSLLRLSTIIEPQYTITKEYWLDIADHSHRVTDEMLVNFLLSFPEIPYSERPCS